MCERGSHGYRTLVSISSAVILLAAGAILKWAVTAHVRGFSLQTAGTVLFILGIVALVLAVAYTFAPLGARARDGRDVPPL
jgi:1,4-dihydroxy-2-naphthoate octaprenyltransferase